MSKLTAGEVLRYALEAGFSRAHANVMTTIAYYESGWDPNNIGDQTLAKYGSRGLWQIFTGAHNPAEVGVGTGGWDDAKAVLLANPAHNAHAAHVVFLEQGYKAWSTYNNYHGQASFKALTKKVAALSDPRVPVKAPAPVPAPPAPAPAPVAVASKDEYTVVIAGKTYVLAGHALDDAVTRASRYSHNLASLGFSVHDMCLKFVRTCFGVHSGAATAYEAWTVAKSKHTWLPAPANVPGFFKGAGAAGHIVVCAGKGMCWSSDISGNGTISLVSIKHIEQAWGMKFLGWSEDLNGVRVWSK